MLSSRPMLDTITYSGRIAATMGSILVLMKKNKASCVLRTGRSDNANAAGVPSSSTRMVEMPVAKTEFSIAGPMPLSKTCRELIQRRREEQRRRTGRRVALLLERRQDHPEHREEEPEADEPRDDAPRTELAALLLRRHGRIGCRRALLNCGSHQAASSLPENDLKINRSAKLAMTIVKITTTTPMAAAWPISKPRNARW